MADIQAWVAAFEPIAQSRGVELSLDQSETQWQAFYDADKVEKIAANLIANALKFTNRGGKVYIEAAYESTGLTLRISDTGVGIPPEKTAHRFRPFLSERPPKKLVRCWLCTKGRA